MASATSPDAISAQPLGPDSVVWRLGFPRTALLYAGRALMLQVAHPAVGAGVRDFSDFRADPWGRLDRTVDSLLLQLFGGERTAAEADRLRELHATINGSGFAGERYSALQPEAWAWVHLANFDSAVGYFDALVRPLTLGEQRQLYADWRQVGRVLGIHDDQLPACFEDVASHVDRIVAERLGANPTCYELLDALRLADVPPPYRSVPDPLWRAVKPLCRRLLYDFTVGTLPPLLRAKLNLAWTPTDDDRLAREQRAVRTCSRLVPARLGHYPAGYRAMREARRR